jgi:hypothetical protein
VIVDFVPLSSLPSKMIVLLVLQRGAKLFLFRSIFPACISAFGAKNEAAKAFFAITGFILVGDFLATFAFAVFWHYKPSDFCLGMYCRVMLRRRLLLLLVSSELILVSSLPAVRCPTRFTCQLPKLPRTSWGFEVTE